MKCSQPSVVSPTIEQHSSVLFARDCSNTMVA